jgi:hypothetical protein
MITALWIVAAYIVGVVLGAIGFVLVTGTLPCRQKRN